MNNALVVPTIETFRNRIVNCEALTLLGSLPSQSVHCIVTSPPYFGLRSYLPYGHPDKEKEVGLEDTPAAFINRLVTIFREARRVLRDDGTLWINMGDSYSKSTTGRKDTLSGRRINGKLISSKVMPETRHREISGLPSKNLLLMPSRLAIALQEDGWIVRSDIIWSKPAPMPESVKDRPTKAHEYVYMLAKSQFYFYDQDAVREPHKPQSLERYEYGMNSGAPDDGMVSAGAANPRSMFHTDRMADNMHPGGRNLRSVWEVYSSPFPEAHFATFPPALIEPMIKAGCPSSICSACGAPHVRVTEKSFIPQQDVSPGRVGFRGKVADENHWKGFPSTTGFSPSCDCTAGTTRGIVLDPFMGAGTTALVARRLGRDFVGCDLNPEYVEMAQKRIDQEDPTKPTIFENGDKQLSLFAGEVT